MKDTRIRAEEAASYILERAGDPRAAVGIVLGSGLSVLAAHLEMPVVRMPYADVPHFPVTSVAGHPGELAIGSLAGQRVWLMLGRPHFYEGLTTEMVSFPVRVMKAAGLSTLIFTNAAGGLNPAFAPGDLMLITDHINLVGLAGHNPLVGPHDPLLGPRFPAITDAYDSQLQKVATAAAEHLGFTLHRGVYVMVGGPSYETPAEARFLRALGADAVGMSTANEVTVARQGGQRVLGISCITNVLPNEQHSAVHDDVLSVARRAEHKLLALIKEVIREMNP